MWVSITGERPWQVFITQDIYGPIMHYHKSFSFWGRNMIIINQTFELTLGCPHMELWVINNPWLWTYPFYGFKHSCLDPLFDVYCAEIILRWETPGPVIQLCCWHPRPPQIIENIQCVSFTHRVIAFLSTTANTNTVVQERMTSLWRFVHVSSRPRVTLGW